MDAMVEERLKGCILCQAVINSSQKEPVHTTPIPEKTWNTLCTDLFGPLPTGEYLVLVQCQQSRFPEVAITHSTAADTVIPAMDKILAAYGTPEVMMSDNGPPFNSMEFTKYAKKRGFRHRKITPLAPWVNGTAERFMKSLAKVVQIAHADHKNWRHALVKFLLAYRAAPHAMTGVPPAELMFNGRKYATNLPDARPRTHCPQVQKALANDQLNKLRMKTNADEKANVREADIHVGDQVLLKQKKQNKFSTPYEVEPYTVELVKGSQITASNKSHQVVRHANMFKKLHSTEEREQRLEVEAEDTGETAEDDHLATERAQLRDSASGSATEEETNNAETAATLRPIRAQPPAPVLPTGSEDQPEQPPPVGRPRRTNVQAPARFRDQAWST